MASTFQHQSRPEADDPLAGPGRFSTKAIEADAKAHALFEERPSDFLLKNRPLIEARIQGISHPGLLALWIQVEKGRQGSGPRQYVLNQLNARRAEITGASQ